MKQEPSFNALCVHLLPGNSGQEVAGQSGQVDGSVDVQAGQSDIKYVCNLN